MVTAKNEKDEFIRVGTTLYKLVNQPRLNGGYVKKRIVWNNETLRQDYGKDYLATVPKYDGFCTVPNHVDYRPVVDKFLNLYEPIERKISQCFISHKYCYFFDQFTELVCSCIGQVTQPL